MNQVLVEFIEQNFEDELRDFIYYIISNPEKSKESKKILERLERLCASSINRIPKQYLDSKFRSISRKELKLPVNSIADKFFKPEGLRREDIEIAVQGGLEGIKWTFEENRIVHAVFSLMDKRGYPEYIKVSRHDFYEAMGVESYIDADGKKRYYEGPGGIKRIELENQIKNISRKMVPFIYSAITGYDKKGKPLRTLAIDYAPILKIIPVYENVKEKEFEEFRNKGKKVPGKRLSHYEIRLNPNILGDVKKYFRNLPSTLAREISDYRKAKNQRPSAYELDFIEFLYLKNQTPIEINYRKLAKKLKIKSLRNKKDVRNTLDRCYQTALDLKFALRIEKDVNGLFETKDIIHLNPNRFYKLRIKERKQ